MSGTQTSGVFPTTSEHIPPLALNENPSYDAVTAQLQRSYNAVTAGQHLVMRL